ncbi:hypothetical protein [Amnibacterium kyonggiense]|uniref:hypothetical protein n=1 Tax=Amnibacterium kyonggiense TaxID=595671 RepID=UPI001061A790|nr:hypothetical protein [Amnibacterium kyonggiense]
MATVTAAATPTPTPTPPGPADAAAAAKAIRSSAKHVAKVVEVTEDNDPNKLIGRSNGYVSAAVLYDSRTACSDGLGADCGAMVEQWGSPADAKQRSEYIQKILKASPVLGSEYDTVQGSFLLRVAGDLKPSQAKTYASLFEEQFQN